MSGSKVRETFSICPVCRKRIGAQQVQRDGMVFLEKTCPEHGFFSTVVWRGYQDIELWRKSAKRLSLSNGDDCPNACGLCPNHQSGTCCVLLEVTKRCNLRCPYCFAEGGDGGDRLFSDIIADIKALAIKGQTLLQLSGGEPTVRDDLPDIIREAKQAGCRYVQLNSNGVRLAGEFSYVQALKEAGLSFVFMQFDGMDDAVYQTLRGQALFEIKKQAIENCGRLKIGVTLVPTVVPGVNDHQIGDILRFAASQSPNVRGVHFQPVSYFGRTPKTPTDEMRYTLDQMMHDIGVQAADVLPENSLRPSRCDHPLCGFHGDYLVKPDGKLYSLLQQEEQDVQATAEQNRAFVARRWDRSRSACGGEAGIGAERVQWTEKQGGDRDPARRGQAGALSEPEGSVGREVTAIRGDWQAASADRARSAGGSESRSAPGGTGSECAQWAIKRAEGSVSKEVCQAVAKADDHCEQRENSEAEVAAMRDDWQAESGLCCCEDAAKAYVCSEETGGMNPINLSDMGVFLQRVRTHGFTVTAMAFQDAGNLDLERLKRCSLHVYRDGKFVPFCKYYL